MQRSRIVHHQVTKRSPGAGYTLIEAMITVAIIGILAAIAVPTYVSYLYRSKTVEAIGFLAEIKGRQEAYRVSYKQYCDASGPGTEPPSSTASNLWPTSTPGSAPNLWNASGIPAGWSHLGAAPPSPQVLFSYVCSAGGIGTNPNTRGYGELGYDDTDFWFVARAVGDLDGDGTQVTFETYSHRQSIWKSAEWE
jgi:prepilin-type N-terminal cleavage/methylation domain-containing protein